MRMTLTANAACRRDKQLHKTIVLVFATFACRIYVSRWMAGSYEADKADKRSTDEHDLLAKRAVHSSLRDGCGCAHIGSASSLKCLPVRRSVFFKYLIETLKRLCLAVARMKVSGVCVGSVVCSRCVF